MALTKTAKTNTKLDRMCREVLTRRIREEVGCKKPEVIRHAVWRLLPTARKLADRQRSKANVDRALTQGISTLRLQREVSYSGACIRRQKEATEESRRNNRHARRAQRNKLQQHRGRAGSDLLQVT